MTFRACRAETYKFHPNALSGGKKANKCLEGKQVWSRLQSQEVGVYASVSQVLAESMPLVGLPRAQGQVPAGSAILQMTSESIPPGPGTLGHRGAIEKPSKGNLCSLVDLASSEGHISAVLKTAASSMNCTSPFLDSLPPQAAKSLCCLLHQRTPFVQRVKVIPLVFLPYTA